MIYVKATVKGEPDASPLFITYQYNNADEPVFINSVTMVRERLRRGLRLNVNEAMLIYCAYVVSQLRELKPTTDIEHSARLILSSDNVMIGVAETLNEILVEATVDKLPKEHLIFKSPIDHGSKKVTKSP